MDPPSDLRDRVNGGVSVPAAKQVQTMLALTRHRNPLVEISLLRQSVGALSARRLGCVHCHRTPLVGEVVHMYGDRLVCELCRPLRREPPGRTETVRSPEHQRAVRRT
jgi:hypothetical protein